jgi:hypothetical protein
MAYQQRTNQRHLPKFKRKKEPEEMPVIIQPRDIEILKQVYQYRFLNSDHIRALMDGHNNKAISQRLTKLYRAGYLDRPIEQVRLYYKYEQQGSSPIIYALGKRGAKILSENGYQLIDALDWTRKNQEIRERTLLHDLGVANFGVCLKLAIEKAPNTQLLYWYQDRQDREKIQDQVILDNKKQTIIPDAVFRIQYPKGRPLFFLEYYREILTNNTRYLKEKLLRYSHYYNQKRHTKKYEAKHFRVITLVPTKDRAENLINLIKQLKIKELDDWKFWFVCIEDVDINKPQTILKPIFREPDDKKGHSLLE